LIKSGNPDIMFQWTFYDFLDTRGNNLVRAWLDSLPPKAAAKIDVRILFMRTVRMWPEAYVSSLTGWPKLVELRIGSAGTQCRPIGCYGPAQGEFTILLGAVEKGRLPRRILEVADANRLIAFSDRRRIAEHVFYTATTTE
jgi:hypothetical protein